jgi:uncharacterized protein
MATRLQNLAAAHSTLWHEDSWYRLSWFVWPLSVISLVAGWLIFHGAPTSTGGQAPWVAPAEEALSADDAYRLGNSAKTDAAAFERLKRLAEGGDRNAQFSLATLYDPEFNLSKLTEPDINQAIAWYTKSAEQGHAMAQLNLGRFFYNGKYGVTQNFATAVYWFEKSVAQGYVWAERALAQCYRTGNGVAADPVRALELYQRAANQGNADAESSVGDAYEHGWGGARTNWSEALNWYLKAADHGDAWGQMKVGAAYLNGNGLQRDPNRAFDLLQRAAQQGQAGAQFYLGSMYDQGLATAADPYQAYQWFEKAASNGNTAAQNALGVAYAKGRGVAQDMEKARYWFEQAKAKGNSDAAANLRRLR